ncbi:carbohydrate ABC transporter permease [Halocatena halophila]|uniref:carbohydrate ABC transporter permease n=1 Tax=Halocatena halophila TaxID=2814576 RepID=UPI002ED3E008
MTDGGSAVSTDEPTLLSNVSDEFLGSLLFWLPPFLLMGFFVYGAIGWNFVISLTETSGFGGVDYSQLDIEQYTRAFGDPTFINATTNTFVLLITFTAVCLAIGLLLAIMMDRKLRFDNGFRTIYLLPMSLSFVVTAQFWLWMYNYDNGLINIIISSLGFSKYQWISNPDLVLSAVIFALVWQFSGYAMVVYLAGLRAIPQEQYEAARTDGANTLRLYQRVIIPQLKGATISASVVLMVFALKAFDFLYSLTGSYIPPKGSDILATMMVRQAFRINNQAYAAAIGIMLFALALAIITPYLTYQHRRGEL